MNKRVLRLQCVLSLLLCFVMVLSSGSVSFSVFAAESIRASAAQARSISTKCRTTDGNTYKVTVRYSAETGIPADARLDVREIPQTDDRYEVKTEAEMMSSFPNAYEFLLSCREKLAKRDKGEGNYAEFTL